VVLLGRVTNTYLTRCCLSEGQNGASSTRPVDVVALPGECWSPQGRSTPRCRLGAQCSCKRGSRWESHGGRLGDISSTARRATPPPAGWQVNNLGPARIERLRPEHADSFRRDIHSDLRRIT